jgi:hypothetical protein
MTQPEKQIEISLSEAGGLDVVNFGEGFTPQEVSPGIVKALLDSNDPRTYTVRQGETPHQVQIWPHLSPASVTWLGDVFGVEHPVTY